MSCFSKKSKIHVEIRLLNSQSQVYIKVTIKLQKERKKMLTIKDHHNHALYKKISKLNNLLEIPINKI